MKNSFSIPLYIYFSLSVFLLCTLGTWQFNKNYENKKRQKIYDLSKEKNLSENINFFSKITDLTSVEIKGIELVDKAVYLQPRTFNGEVGFHKIVVYDFNEQFVLVNQGFTKIKSKKVLQSKTKMKKVKGLIIKVPKPKFFELDNDLENEEWFTLDLDDLKKKFKLNLSPYIIYQQNFEKNTIIKAVVPNYISSINHLNYALTWYFLCLTLCVIFFIHNLKFYKNANKKKK